MGTSWWDEWVIFLFSGLALMLLLIPVNAVISMKQRKLQVDLMKFKDKRLKLMSEVLNGMKVHVHTIVEPQLSGRSLSQVPMSG